MMRSKFKMGLGTLLGVLALGTLVAASASAAEPEFSKLLQNVNGSSGTVTFVGPGGTRSQFEKSTLSGKMTSKSMLSSVSLLFKGSGGAEGDCTNTENNTGLSITGLNAKLGWINKAKNEVGLMFIPPKQPMVASCRWRQENRGIIGEFIGKITPVGTRTSKYTVTLEAPSGVQFPQYFEGGKETSEIFPLAFGSCNYEEYNKKIIEECTRNLPYEIETSLELTTPEAMEITP